MQSTVFPVLPKPLDLTLGMHPSAFINPFIGSFSPPPFWNYPFWNALSPFYSVVNPFSSSGAVPFASLTPTRTFVTRSVTGYLGIPIETPYVYYIDEDVHWKPHSLNIHSENRSGGDHILISSEIAPSDGNRMWALLLSNTHSMMHSPSREA
uniref:Uncharacterized protein n=1 Tax=Parascaris equorum TaxID=6256 RepID=A0A914RIR6_PAREQ